MKGTKNNATLIMMIRMIKFAPPTNKQKVIYLKHTQEETKSQYNFVVVFNTKSMNDSTLHTL